MKERAKLVECSVHKEDEQRHSYLDFCSECGHYWIWRQVCPKCDYPVDSDTGYCKKCKKFYQLNERE